MRVIREARTLTKYASIWTVAVLLLSGCGSSAPVSVSPIVKSACLSATTAMEPAVEDEVQSSNDFKGGKLTLKGLVRRLTVDSRAAASALAKLEHRLSVTKAPIAAQRAPLHALASATDVLSSSLSVSARDVAAGKVSAAVRVDSKANAEVLAVNRASQKFGFPCVL